MIKILITVIIPDIYATMLLGAKYNDTPEH